MDQSDCSGLFPLITWGTPHPEQMALLHEFVQIAEIFGMVRNTWICHWLPNREDFPTPWPWDSHKLWEKSGEILDKLGLHCRDFTVSCMDLVRLFWYFPFDQRLYFWENTQAQELETVIGHQRQFAFWIVTFCDFSSKKIEWRLTL